ncbi:MAG: hypothetical protein AAF135_24930 [Bacteroidota bacterium]
MITLVKLLTLFSLSAVLAFPVAYRPIQKDTLMLPTTESAPKVMDDPKSRAFYILENKCNVCHRKRNKRRVFNPEKMDGWANDVYEQVFLRKRMPQGRKIKLTSEEYEDLLTWISSTKTKK